MSEGLFGSVCPALPRNSLKQRHMTSVVPNQGLPVRFGASPCSGPGTAEGAWDKLIKAEGTFEFKLSLQF